MFNHVGEMGRLVSDPELKTTPAGVSVTSFRIAVERNYTDKDGNRQADFFDVVAWRGTAEFINRQQTNLPPAQQGPGYATDYEAPPLGDDDLPF